MQKKKQKQKKKKKTDDKSRLKFGTERVNYLGRRAWLNSVNVHLYYLSLFLTYAQISKWT